jgi:hypothetical protein
MIAKLMKDISNAKNGLNLNFSVSPFPNYQIELEWVREEFGGNRHKFKNRTLEGWICAALFKYFKVAPKSIFAKAEKL